MFNDIVERERLLEAVERIAAVMEDAEARAEAARIDTAKLDALETALMEMGNRIDALTQRLQGGHGDR